MTSTQSDIELSYSVSNDFFRLWLDENMHYTSAVFASADESLEVAQERKANILYDFSGCDATKTILDIGCGWGSMLDVAVRRGCKEAVGITLSTAQAEWARARKLKNTSILIQDYATYAPAKKFDSLVSVEMIDHLCSPEQARLGKAVDIYRGYFNKLAEWVEPGACFGFQAILTNRIPRTRKDLQDLQFTADVIFPGGRNPRLEELVAAVNPRWEILELHTRREDYGRTTGEWLRRMRLHEAEIRRTWGDQVFDDYDRYLSTCVRGFANHWSGDVQMKLRRID
ncbi:MAG: class I SAM-dependent methyltransferase [Myxococcota bacterium]